MLTEDDWPISRALILYATLIGAAYYYRNVPWFYNMFKDTFLTKKAWASLSSFACCSRLRRHRARLGIFASPCIVCFYPWTNRMDRRRPARTRPGGDDLHASINSGRGASPGATRLPPPAARIHQRGGQARGEGAVDRCDVRRADDARADDAK